MLGILNEQQVNNVLVSQSVGRLACTNGKKPYVVPITYVFDGKNIIAQSREGQKVSIMRKNPQVCFQADMIVNMANWQSVVIEGKFKELKGKSAIAAKELLFNKVMPLKTSSTIHPHEHAVQTEIGDEHRNKQVMYMISIEKKSGRFEKE